MAYCWAWEPFWDDSDRRLGPALLRLHESPEVAMLTARAGLEEARASECPVRVNEWAQAVKWLRSQHPECERRSRWRIPTLRELIEYMEGLSK